MLCVLRVYSNLLLLLVIRSGKHAVSLMKHPRADMYGKAESRCAPSHAMAPQVSGDATIRVGQTAGGSLKRQEWRGSAKDVAFQSMVYNSHVLVLRQVCRWAKPWVGTRVCSDCMGGHAQVQKGVRCNLLFLTTVYQDRLDEAP